MEAEADPSAHGEHGSFLLKQLDRMRAVKELTDVVLLAEGMAFPCHKVVLSAFSPYFQAMFTCGLKETWGEEVPLRDTPALSLELLLNYMYRAELPLSNNNIQGVASAAFLLHVDGAFRLCQRHMEACMDPSNCVGLYHWARDLGAVDLADSALRYLCQHFAQVCEEEEVLELDAQRLGDLLGSDDLNISQEEIVLELVLRWAERRRSDSQSEAQAVELLRHVRLELVDPGFLRKTRRRNPVLLRDAECFGRIDAALQTSGLSETAAPPRPPLRYGMETTDLLLCLGGVDEEGVPARRGGLADLSFCFAPRGRKIYYISSPLRGYRGMAQVTAGVVTRDNNIVVAVEAEDQHRMKKVDIYRYCSSENSWVELCSAPYRDMYAFGLVGDSLYLIGGQMKVRNHYLITDSVERWSLKRGDSWLSFAPLPLPLACHCAVSLKEHLYVLGGWTPQDQPDDEPDKLCNRVFQFDPSKDRWTERAKMKYSRYRCGTAVLNGEIYVIGGIGCDGEDRGQSRRCLSSVEIYNPDTDTWRSGPTLPTSLLSLRSNTSNTGGVEGKIYICGYYKGAEFLFLCVSGQSVFEKRQCVFQVTHPKNRRYTAAGNVSGSVQLCEKTRCCVAIYHIINDQPKVDTLACDMVETFCPDATCKARQSLGNRFLRCVCNTDLCNTNITWAPEAEQPSHTHSHSAVGPLKMASVVIPALCLVLTAAMWRRFCKEKKKDLLSSRHDCSVQPAPSCQTRTSENYITGIELQRVMGQGRFATVFQGKYKGSAVVVKMYHAGWSHLFTTEKEIYELPLMKHNGIARFLGTGWKPDDNSWFIVLQHAKYGSLHSFLCKHTTSWMQSLKLCCSLSQGLSYLHSDICSHDVQKPPVAHRDLSSSNVLVKGDGTCALCDFGCSTILHLGSGHHLWQHHDKNMKGHAQFGTLHYTSPEILEGSTNLNSSSYLMHGDIYSLGLVLWEIWMRCTDLFEGGIVPQHLLPYELELEANVTLERLVLYVSEMDKRPSIPESWEHLPQGSSMKELLTDCWDRDADARLTAACVVNRLVSLQASLSV